MVQLLDALQALISPDRQTGRRDLVRKVDAARQRTKWDRSLARRLPGVNGIPIDRPIFLLGVQGGGLTLIRRVLTRNAVVCTASGNSTHWAAPLDEFGKHESRMRRLPPALRHARLRGDIAHPVFGTEHGGIYASDELLASYRRTAADATPDQAEAFKRLIREHILVYAHDPQHARFLDKTQTYTVALAFVNELLRGHDPYFVLVVRSPYAASLTRATEPVPVPEDEKIRLAAQHWRNSVACALEDGEAVEHFHVVRFEDFARDPAAVTREICAFAQLEFDPAMLGGPGERLPRQVLADRKWFPIRPDQAAGPEVAAIVEPICGELAAKFGY